MLGALQIQFCTRALARPQQDLRAASPRAPSLQLALRVNRGNPEKEQGERAASAGQNQRLGDSSFAQDTIQASLVGLFHETCKPVVPWAFSFCLLLPKGAFRVQKKQAAFQILDPASGNSEMQAAPGWQGPQAAGSLAPVPGQREPRTLVRARLASASA